MQILAYLQISIILFALTLPAALSSIIAFMITQKIFFSIIIGGVLNSIVSIILYYAEYNYGLFTNGGGAGALFVIVVIMSAPFSFLSAFITLWIFKKTKFAREQ